MRHEGDPRVGPSIRSEMRRGTTGCQAIVLCVVLMVGILVGRGSYTPRARAEPVRYVPPVLRGLPSEDVDLSRSAASGPAAAVQPTTATPTLVQPAPLPTLPATTAATPTAPERAVDSEVPRVPATRRPPWLRVPAWEPTPAEAPWYYKGERGSTPRAKKQLEMRKNCGFQQRDSPLPSSGTAEQPVLSGVAWHHGPGNCPARCALHGVCTPSGRCDCGPYYWGPDCSIPVRTQQICVYNDSRPWFCDKPACVDTRGETRTVAGVTSTCVGAPLAACPSKCSGRGSCQAGVCACYEGFKGEACESATEYGVDQSLKKSGCLGRCSGRGECERGFCRCTPPYWGADCAMAPAGGPRCRRRPCVYVYELPARMNVLGLKVEADWRQQIKGRKFDYRTPPLVHEALLASAHRTSDASEADLFYVPTWDWHGSWGNPEVYYRAHHYIRTVHPFWNASGGADHLWTIARDAAACATPWGSLREELQSSIILSNWGGVTGLSGAVEERCFRPRWDVVLPGTLKAEVVEKSPWLMTQSERAAQLARRTTQLFFFGAAS